MTNRATRACWCVGCAGAFRDSSRARIGQNRKGAGMKILARPGDVLAAFFAGPAVAAGRSTTNRPDKYFAALASLFYVGTLRRGEDAKAEDDVEKQDRTRRPHPNLLPEGEGSASLLGRGGVEARVLTRRSKTIGAGDSRHYTIG